MEQLRVRCPACQKLYEVQTDAISSQTPYFQCKACRSVFAFEYPPKDLNQVNAYVVHREEPPVLAVEAEPALEKAVEPETPAVVLEAEPSLVQLWNHIFEDFDDEERHDEFVKKCNELDALAFARMKYQDLVAVTGQDELSLQTLKKIEALMQVKAEQKAELEKASVNLTWTGFWSWVKSKNWQRFVLWTPLLVSVVMVVLGMSNLGLRNLIGFGVAIAFLGYGLIVIFRGRIRLSDFLK